MIYMNRIFLKVFWIRTNTVNVKGKNSIIWMSHGVLTETQKGLKRVTLICLLCPVLVIIHFRKYPIWNEKKR